MLGSRCYPLREPVNAGPPILPPRLRAGQSGRPVPRFPPNGPVTAGYKPPFVSPGDPGPVCLPRRSIANCGATSGQHPIFNSLVQLDAARPYELPNRRPVEPARRRPAGIKVSRNLASRVPALDPTWLGRWQHPRCEPRAGPRLPAFLPASSSRHIDHAVSPSRRGSTLIALAPCAFDSSRSRCSSLASQQPLVPRVLLLVIPPRSRRHSLRGADLSRHEAVRLRLSASPPGASS